MSAQKTAARPAVRLATAGLAILLIVAIVLVPSPSPRPSGGPVVFGVAPGSAPRTPEDAAKTMSALRRLKPPGAPLVVHLYSGYIGPEPWARYRALLSRELAVFERAGFDVELVLRFAPLADRGSPRDVREFVALVRRIVGVFGANRRFVSVQVTNEADRGASAASDGHFNRGHAAWQALIQGVIAAKETARARHFDQLSVGFNYATNRESMWRYLGRYGGASFARAVDWVGIDTYPGTLTPLPANGLRRGIADSIRSSVDEARRLYLPLARIPARVALHFSENGYATSLGHSDAMQVTALASAVDTVASLARPQHVTEYAWFDLRDPSNSSRGPAYPFGLLRHDYRPKPAFAAYRRLIDHFS